jgi:DNA adenine methylase
MTLSVPTPDLISAPPVQSDLALDPAPMTKAARSRSVASSRTASMSPHAPFANAPAAQLSLDLYQARPRPFPKWAGGKGSLVPQLRELLPSDLATRRYVEPFVGGGALFFALEPRRALLRDINRQLVATYRCVQQTVEPLIERLSELQRTHNAEQYYEIRTHYNATPVAFDSVERVAQFIYLNRTCFNGLHRVNRKGEFNVPMGRYASPRIVDHASLLAARRALQRAQIVCHSFSDLVRCVEPDDFVYLDPPYDEEGGTAFTQYDNEEFGPQQQHRLAKVVAELDRRGCKFMLSNSNTVRNRRALPGFSSD